MNRDLVRSAVADVENFLQSHSADDDVMNSLKLIKHAIVALDNPRLKYDLHSAQTHELPLHSAQTHELPLQSDISSGITQNTDLNKNWCFTLRNFTENLTRNPFFLQCCDQTNVRQDTEDTPLDVKTQSNRNNLPSEQASKHFVGNSRRHVLLKDEHVEEYMKQLGSNWHLDLLALANLPSVISQGPVISIGRHLLRLIGEAIDPNFNELILPVLRDIQDVYIPNPYHNALHGAMVGHMSQILFKAIRSERTLTPYEELGYILAALGHDAGHPGKTNAFLSLTSNPLALIYNDNSILENYHSSLVFHIIRYHSKFFNLIPSKEWDKVRKRMIQLILSTDMTTHFTHINNIKERRESGLFDVNNDDDFWLLMVLCIKVADIGHNFLPWVDHISWTSLLFEEFYLQGDEERFLSMPLLLFFDRTKAADIPDSQLGFFQGFTRPLLDELALFENESKFISRVLLSNAEKNLVYWKESSLKKIEDILRDLDPSKDEFAIEDESID